MPKPTSTIRVAVAGAAGKMGSELCRWLVGKEGIELVSAIDRNHVGEPLNAVVGGGTPAIPIVDGLGSALDNHETHVLVDFTHPGAAADHAISAMKRGIAAVIGTSGIGNDGLSEMKRYSQEFQTPCLIVPNFAIGAVLMMQFAQTAARYFPDCEVIEYHHNQKADAPSGTAKRTAELIAASRRKLPGRKADSIIKVEGVRGGNLQGVTIHSVRLPGFVAHQEVIFGGSGEMLTIRHDSQDRSSFMYGVELCVRKIWDLNGLQTGLEHVLD